MSIANAACESIISARPMFLHCHEQSEMKRRLRGERNRERDALRGRIGAGRFRAMVKDLAGLVRLAFETGETASIFGLEGPLRAALRADSCRQGWGWTSADLMVRDLMAEVFQLVGAERPDWHEGQPEWTINAGTLTERTRCVRCYKPLPEGHYKFCSRFCNTSHAHLGRLPGRNDQSAPEQDQGARDDPCLASPAADAGRHEPGRALYPDPPRWPSLVHRGQRQGTGQAMVGAHGRLRFASGRLCRAAEGAESRVSALQ
ncbi:hypothetical protein ACNKFW_08070 [Paracoccus sp. TD-10]|uniref:hypothetical protein n=1 Tax=Paracoccus sp. TD-10 TaxID=3395918 RepID=UPI003AAD6798